MKKRIILESSIEILLCIFIICFSIYLWINSELTYYIHIAKEYENYPVINNK